MYVSVGVRVCWNVCMSVHTVCLAQDGLLGVDVRPSSPRSNRTDLTVVPKRVGGDLSHHHVTRIAVGTDFMVALAGTGVLYSWGRCVVSNRVCGSAYGTCFYVQTYTLCERVIVGIVRFN